MTNFFPFFLECSKQEVDKNRKKELENLAFGSALVITKGNRNVLITDKEEFVIPDDFSLESWNELKNKLWKDQNTIKDKSNSWTVTKKRDKIRRLDNLIIQAIQNNDNRKFVKIMLMRLILLKLVKISDIELQDFDVKKV